MIKTTRNAADEKLLENVLGTFTKFLYKKYEFNSSIFKNYMNYKFIIYSNNRLFNTNLLLYIFIYFIVYRK